MKSKKLWSFVCAFILFICFASFEVKKASAAEFVLDEADLCLQETFELIADDMILNDYNRQEIYNYNLEPFGYAYNISASGQTGFALIIKRAYFYEVTELYFNKEMPFANINGLAVYLTPLSYIEFVNGQYFDIQNGELIEAETLLKLYVRGFGFKGGTPGQIVEENISYDSRTVDEGNISGKVPAYFNINPDITSGCAVVAGSVLVGYYSRYYPELTPGFVVGRAIGISYTYYDQGTPSRMQNTINDLYVQMGTNVGGPGTTASGFRNGLSSHIASKGKTITYSNVVNNNILDYNLFKSYINNLKPVALFFNTYNLISDTGIKTNGTTDTVIKQYYSGLHVMISFGYKQIMYYKNGNNFRTDYYTKVSTGQMDMYYGFVRLYDGAILQEAYAINVF